MPNIYIEICNRRDTSELIYYIDQLLNDPRVKEIFVTVEVQREAESTKAIPQEKKKTKVA